MTTSHLTHVFDTFRSTLRNLHPADRMSAVARMVGRPELVANDDFRSTFSAWRKGVAL